MKCAGGKWSPGTMRWTGVWIGDKRGGARRSRGSERASGRGESCGRGRRGELRCRLRVG